MVLLCLQKCLWIHNLHGGNNTALSSSYSQLRLSCHPCSYQADQKSKVNMRSLAEQQEKQAPFLKDPWRFSIAEQRTSLHGFKLKQCMEMLSRTVRNTQSRIYQGSVFLRHWGCFSGHCTWQSSGKRAESGRWAHSQTRTVLYTSGQDRLSPQRKLLES